MDKTQQLGKLLEEMLQDLLKSSNKSIDDLMLGEFPEAVAHAAAMAGLRISERQALEAERTRKQEEEEKEETFNALVDNLNAAIDTRCFNYKTAAAACTLAYMGTHNLSLRRKESDRVFSIFLKSLEENDQTLTLGRAAKESIEKKGVKTEDTDRGEEIERMKGVLPSPTNPSISFYTDADRKAIENFLKRLAGK